MLSVIYIHPISNNMAPNRMRIAYTYVKTFFFWKRLIIDKQNPKNDVIDPNVPKA